MCSQTIDKDYSMTKLAWILILICPCLAVEKVFYNAHDVSVRQFEKPNAYSEATKEQIRIEGAARKVSHHIVKKMLEQGDVLHDDKKAIIDDKINSLNITCDECAKAVSALHIFNTWLGRKALSAVAVEACQVVCHWLQSDLCTKLEKVPDWSIKPSGTPKPPLKPRQRPSHGSPTSKVLFFTDVHMDMQYEAGVTANCGEPLCCRNTNRHASSAMDAAGKWGDYRNCDMPPWTVEGMMKNLSNYHFDFILFTGDIPAHDVWNQSKSDQIDRNNGFTQLILKYFPGVPLYPALGNHASSPVNSFPPPQVKHAIGGDISWLYNAVTKNWKNWIPEKDLITARQGGFYTTMVRKGLRVVSLNNNYCSSDNWWLRISNYSVDPVNQLKWMVQVMQKAEDNGEKVIILSHRPTDGCMEPWSRNYYNIIMRYEAIIIAQFFGHAHTDELKLFYDNKDSSRLASVGFIGPGYTTYSYLNAGYRIFTFDGDYEGSTQSLIDATTYYLDIEEANESDKPVWRHEYSFREDYGMKGMTPKDFEDLMERFDEDLDLFQSYHQHVTKDKDMSYCDSRCRDNAIRGIKKTIGS